MYERSLGEGRVGLVLPCDSTVDSEVSVSHYVLVADGIVSGEKSDLWG